MSQNKSLHEKELPKKILFGILKTVLVAAFWIGVWFLLSYKVNSEFLLPSPRSVLSALGTLAAEAEFWKISMTSLYRVLLGITVSLVIGIALATATSYSKILKALASPVISVVKATPVASFIILACVWLERDILPTFITSLIVVPIVWSNISEGFLSVDENLKEVAKIYKFSLFKRIYRLYIPSVAPFFLAACKSSLGMAWKAGIAAEVLAVPKHAIGTELYYSKTYLDTPTMFAWTLVTIVLSIIIEKLFVSVIELFAKRLHIAAKGGTQNAKNN